MEGNRETLMPFFHFLVIALMTSASIAPLTAQTKQHIEQLPRGCMYMLYMNVPVGESPFPRPVVYREEPFFKDGINLTGVVAPSQFLLHSLPSSAENLISPMPAFFPEPHGLFVMVCGLHPENL